MKHLISKVELQELLTKGEAIDEIYKRTADYIFKRGFDNGVERLHRLPLGYQTVFASICASAEINNGGFYQYFGNSTAEQYHTLAVAAFERIGAHKISRLFEDVFETICKQSISFRTSYRVDGVRAAFDHANDCLEEIHIEGYDDKFYALDSGKENVDALLAKYILENIDDF